VAQEHKWSPTHANVINAIDKRNKPSAHGVVLLKVRQKSSIPIRLSRTATYLGSKPLAKPFSSEIINAPCLRKVKIP